jgi:hypothetical protein
LSSERAPSDPVRDLLLRLAEENGIGLAPLSKAIGKNHAYLQQFISRRRPLVLPAAVRQALGQQLHCAPEMFLPAEERPASPGAPHIDPQLLARANDIARRMVGGDPDLEEIRLHITGALYTLLQRGALRDEEGTRQVLELLGRTLRDVLMKMRGAD